MHTVLVTGANRGIGLEFVRQYAEEGWKIHACCRDPKNAEALAAIKGDITIHRLDVTDDKQIAHLVKELKGDAIDIVINNAGVGGGDDSTDPEEWLKVFQINSIAPVRVAEALLPNLEMGSGKIVASLTSRMGSIADNGSGGSYAYRSSKAALNAAMKSLAIDWHRRGIIVVVAHPGWVKTDMGGPSALISPQRSVSGLRQKLSALKLADSGGFFNYDGSVLPW
ncbi:MAG TPA: SDR family oxidoreductase [Hypericibacter adhaerens]|jgi:NAD(P)-dependent dehydrogenase (short-subunit alcohol dehydrogenase family)|uniref:Oxidoreductase n=1 Tax=Hypericibacter adhaerens TaxID=2602016 RepID=A0A5J6MXS9_9PROT|nr:SDR family oxidoreductase [Hypericibacter adhaerens]QEX21927.1 oxidoreductase [Hypericibacter adhaerens]HWA44102.1 SDR family oxidoreductase [Hypericibacter adhaerens]